MDGELKSLGLRLVTPAKWYPDNATDRKKDDLLPYLLSGKAPRGVYILRVQERGCPPNHMLTLDLRRGADGMVNETDPRFPLPLAWSPDTASRLLCLAAVRDARLVCVQ